MKDIHGQAILDYHNGERNSRLYINNSYGEPEEMPIEAYFKGYDEFSEMDQRALDLCYGKTLDIGAAAGNKALALQAMDKEVYALESSPGCIETMKSIGIKHVMEEDYKKHHGKYDTILLMMNGLGIAGTLNEIPEFLRTCKNLLNPGGQIVLDSSDIKYLYEEYPDIEVPYPYYGDIQYQYEYKGEQGDWFDWVYTDQDMLGQIVADSGLTLEVQMEDEYDQYLAVINNYSL
ncbi:MAG: class I SAM-dependent methyltransferase [Cyclobacteriaceae bacterium]